MRYWLLALALLLASPALGLDKAWSKNCQFTGGDTASVIGTPVDTTPVVNAGNVGCYRYNNTAGAHDSIIITVNSTTAVIIFDPQLDAQVVAATTALATPHVCAASSILTSGSPQLSCPYLGGETSHVILDGNEETATTQAIRVPAGIYYFEVSACLAGDTCQIAIKGEQKIQ